LFAAALMAGVFVPAFVSAGSNSDIGSRVDVLEFQAQTLSRSLDALSNNFGGRGLTPPEKIGTVQAGKTVLVAQSRDVAAINLRLSQVEEQMRVLVGQMEGLQFQMTQFQTLIERMKQDTDFRFQQLEGTNSGKTEAATQSGGATLPAGLPQNPELSAPLNLGAPLDTGSQQINTGTLNDTISGPLDKGVVLGSGAGNIKNLDLGNLNGPVVDGGQALDLGFDPGALITNADADAQYRAGYEAVIRGDYQFAETQFRQFIALFPNHPQAPDATNWLGEALLQRGQYDQAAQVLFKGFQIYKDTTRAPDLLLKLGIALAGAGERDTACRTFNEVLKRFPAMGGAFNKRVKEEMVRAKC